jgi:hypothetical protein
MKVKVENRLSGLLPGVDHQPVAVLTDALLLGQPPRSDNHLPQQKGIFLADTVQRGDVAVGDNQNMNRRCRLVIVKGSYLLILVSNFSGRIPSDDLAKNTIFRHFLCLHWWFATITSSHFYLEPSYTQL